MLKKCYGLVLGLMVLAGSACVTPTHASSASVIITAVRAGSATSALQEGVVLYNNSSYEVEISNWCLTNKSSTLFACIETNEAEKAMLPAYSYATIASLAAVTNPQPGAYAAIYESTNHSSGAIIASSDIITLIDSNQQLVDQLSWTSSISSSQQWSRVLLTSPPDFYIDTNASSDWQKQTYTTFPVSQLVYRQQAVVDEPEEQTPPQEPTEPSLNLLPAIVTELLPNAVGSDTGNEFIELYNPNEFDTISLDGYVLSIGLNTEKRITLGNMQLEAKQYKVLTNAEYAYSLLNTSSKVSLKTKQGALASDVPIYENPKEGESWALIDSVWQYTNQPSAGLPNIPSLVDEEAEVEVDLAATVKPCAANQYRNPETNRCRLLASASSAAPAACKEGQERNPETNRCRNISNTSNSTACKAGQERNPETNRCRAIKKLTAADFGVKGATTQNQSGLGWYMWAAIGGVVILVLGYAVWEWREELLKLTQTIKAKFAAWKN